jgi:hypothetical protein
MLHLGERERLFEGGCEQVDLNSLFTVIYECAMDRRVDEEIRARLNVPSRFRRPFAKSVGILFFLPFLPPTFPPHSHKIDFLPRIAACVPPSFEPCDAIAAAS